MPCERGTLSQAQTIIQGVTTVTGEQHLREVMESSRYSDTSVKTASKPSTPRVPGSVGLAWLWFGLAWLLAWLTPPLAIGLVWLAGLLA